MVDTVPGFVDLHRSDLPEAMRKELEALRDARAPETFFCDRSLWGTAFVTVVALVLVVWAVWFWRSEFRSGTCFFSASRRHEVVTFLGLLGAGFLGLLVQNGDLFGSWYGWYNASFGLVRVRGHLVTIFRWEAIDRDASFYFPGNFYRDDRKGNTIFDPEWFSLRRFLSTTGIYEFRAGASGPAVTMVLPDEKTWRAFSEELDRRRAEPTKAVLPSTTRPFSFWERLGVIVLTSALLGWILPSRVLGPSVRRALRRAELNQLWGGHLGEAASLTSDVEFLEHILEWHAGTPGIELVGRKYGELMLPRIFECRARLMEEPEGRSPTKLQLWRLLDTYVRLVPDADPLLREEAIELLREQTSDTTVLWHQLLDSREEKRRREQEKAREE